MKMTVYESEFIQAFKDYGRYENFSFEGLIALYEWLEEVTPDYELDVIGLCCDFVEYENFEEFSRDYDDYDTLRELQCNQLVIMVDDERFIIQAF